VKKHRWPVAKEIPAWAQAYLRWIELARLEYQQMKEIEFPDEATQGQGALQMPDANSNLVQKQLSELTQCYGGVYPSNYTCHFQVILGPRL